MKKKSSFSRRSNLSRSGEFDDQATGGNSGGSTDSKKLEEENSSYLFRMRSDFDRKKNYEETVIKIMNEMPVSKIKEPEDSFTFGEKYPNVTKHKRTIFLDLDDTLTYVTIMKLDHGNLESHELEYKDQSGKSMKVNN